MARGPGLSLHIREKRFGGSTAPLFVDFSLQIAGGSVVAILGQSGVGKSTLLRMVAGIDTQFSGSISINGVPAAAASPPGFVFQDPRLLPWLTAADNVRTARHGMARSAAEDLLAQVGLPEVAELYPRQMSGGMQRRVALARALAANGQLLLLDEPFVSLDRALAEEMHRLLAEVISRSKASVLLVTHEPRDAAELADRVVVLDARPARISREVALAVQRRDRTAEMVARYAAQLVGGPGAHP